MYGEEKKEVEEPEGGKSDVEGSEDGHDWVSA